MGGTRCVGGPEDALLGGCTGPVGANEPGGVTFQKITDLELNLGAGANHVTIDTFTNVPTGDARAEDDREHGRRRRPRRPQGHQRPHVREPRRRGRRRSTSTTTPSG